VVVFIRSQQLLIFEVFDVDGGLLGGAAGQVEVGVLKPLLLSQDGWQIVHLFVLLDEIGEAFILFSVFLSFFELVELAAGAAALL